MSFTPPAPFTTRPTLEGTFGMAASTHATATAVAQAVLERGGNAFDAVVAGGFVLHVVEPHLNGPGGDLVGIFHAAGAAEPEVLMGQGPAPAAATIAHYRGEGLDLVPGAGGLAAAVPGAVDAWLLLLRDHGTWELGDVLAYAIGYARDGHPLLPQAAMTIARVAELFTAAWPSSADLWMPDGRVPAAGSLMRNPAYAAVLERLVAAGDGAAGAAGAAGARAADRGARIDAARHEWKIGLVAQAASAFLARPHRHSSGTDHAAVITSDDFAGFDAGYEPAVTATFRGHTVAKGGAWCQGPVLLEALRILDGFDDARLDPATGIGAHTIVETLKLALADRDAYFGDDPDGSALTDALLSDAYIASRRSAIGDRASREWRPGDLPGRVPFRPPLTEASAAPAPAGVGEPTVAKSGQTRGDTCHIDVVDRWGNIVAVTPSGGWLQSSPTVPELGFCLGTRLQMMWLDESAPSALRPGARPRTTLTPTLVLQGRMPVMALGTPGGDQQDQWQLPMLLRMLVGGYTAQQAIDAPTLHTTALVDSFWPRTWTPAGVMAEDRLGDDVIDELIARGHDVTRAGDWTLGRLSAVGIDRSRGVLWAAANARGMQGYAAGR
ncbi:MULTISPECIES: gamma-glutamyltransferase family protein [unclassified Microbacterium]|uniref:gamma-glutamyltransferase family protein n=1 Tax=unclassified Microbacterium TaxID=2609290 RepID=UPI00214CF6F0|nr:MULTISPECIES: gamma-glutamyltransferase family protein [unclassified Microbacterium]MCR2784466.1 gamma-glutamyltransferase family protein [Microbacterium sp. zg.B96]WIM14722.1 gamma-glutamyltransferase family protein [Microbacterium sp. zg-B96]